MAVGTKLIAPTHKLCIFEKIDEDQVRVVESFNATYRVSDVLNARGLKELGVMVEPSLFDVSKFITQKSFDELAVGTKYLNGPKTAIFEKVEEGRMTRKCLWMDTLITSWTVGMTYTHPFNNEKCWVELTSFDPKLLRPDKKIIKKFHELPIGTLYVRTSNLTFDHHLCWVKISETECRHVNSDGLVQAYIERQLPEQNCAIADVIVPIETLATPQPCTEKVDFALMEVGEEFSASNGGLSYWKKTGNEGCIHKDADTSKWTPDGVTRRSVMHNGSTWVTKELADKIAARQVCTEEVELSLLIDGEMYASCKNEQVIMVLTPNNTVNSRNNWSNGIEGVNGRIPRDTSRKVWVTKATAAKVIARNVATATPKRRSIDCRELYAQGYTTAVRLGQVFYGSQNATEKRWVSNFNGYWMDLNGKGSVVGYGTPVWIDDAPLQPVTDPNIQELVKDGDGWKVQFKKLDMIEVPFSLVKLNDSFLTPGGWYRKTGETKGVALIVEREATFLPDPTVKVVDHKQDFDWILTSNLKKDEWYRLEPRSDARRYFKRNETTAADSPTHMEDRPLSKYGWVTKRCKKIIAERMTPSFAVAYNDGQTVGIKVDLKTPVITGTPAFPLYLLNPDPVERMIGYWDNETNSMKYVTKEEFDAKKRAEKPSSVAVNVAWSPEAKKNADEFAKKLTLYENVSVPKESEMSARKMSFVNVPLGRKFWLANEPDKLRKRVTENHAKYGFNKPEEMKPDALVFLKPLMRQKYAAGITLGAQFATSMMAVAAWITTHIDYSLPLGERVQGVIWPTLSLAFGVALILSGTFMWTNTGEDMKQHLERD